MFTKPIVAYFMIDVNQAIMLYTVNFYSDVCQVFFNKTEKNVKKKVQQESSAMSDVYVFGGEL